MAKAAERKDEFDWGTMTRVKQPPMKPPDAGSLPALPALKDSLSEDEETQVGMEKALINAVLREHPQWPLQAKAMKEMLTIQRVAAHAVERIIGADAYRQNAKSLWYPAKYNPPQLMTSIKPSLRAANGAAGAAARGGPNDVKRPHPPSVVCAGAGAGGGGGGGQGDRNAPTQKSPRAQLAQRKPIGQRERGESGSKPPTAPAAYRQKKAGKKGGVFGERVFGEYPEGWEHVNQLMLLLGEQEKTEVEVVLKLAMPPVMHNSMRLGSATISKHDFEAELAATLGVDIARLHVTVQCRALYSNTFPFGHVFSDFVPVQLRSLTPTCRTLLTSMRNKSTTHGLWKIVE